MSNEMPTSIYFKVYIAYTLHLHYYNNQHLNMYVINEKLLILLIYNNDLCH